MTTRYDVLTSRAGKDGKSYYTKIGTMWPMESGGFKITFDALPIPRIYEGKLSVEAVAWEPRKDGAKGGGAADDAVPY